MLAAISHSLITLVFWRGELNNHVSCIQILISIFEVQTPEEETDSSLLQLAKLQLENHHHPPIYRRYRLIYRPNHLILFFFAFFLQGTFYNRFCVGYIGHLPMYRLYWDIFFDFSHNRLSFTKIILERPDT